MEPQPTPWERCRRLTARQFTTIVNKLPGPSCNLDDSDDPNWVVPVGLFGFTFAAGRYLADLDDIWERCEEGLPDLNPQPIPLEQVRYASQPKVRVDAVAHYLHTDRPYDEHSCFGSDIPVYARVPDGYVVFDGTSRTSAAMLQGATTITAHVAS